MVERDDRLEEALAMIQRAVKAEPKNAAYLDSLGWAYFKLGKLDEAERYFSQAIPTSRNVFSAMHEHLGDVYDRMGKPEQARRPGQKRSSFRLRRNNRQGFDQRRLEP